MHSPGVQLCPREPVAEDMRAEARVVVVLFFLFDRVVIENVYQVAVAEEGEVKDAKDDRGSVDVDD